jgi:uncharacterized protein (DUF1015 family)
MADIQAFRAFRYDLGRVGALSDVIAPPYDVIDGPLQDALYARSPYNVVRLILNKETPADSPTDNRYTRAARALRDWQGDGILVQDSARALYVYHQEFVSEGKRYTRRGFMARVRLERFGEGRIYPHEETMSGPKEDRLKLTRATGMNLSQIFGLYPDPDGAVQRRLEAAVGRNPPLEARDHLGVISRLWPVVDQHAVSAVTGLMGPKPIFIADGHHRYETALRYLDERRQAGDQDGGMRDEGGRMKKDKPDSSLIPHPSSLPSDSPPNFVLMMLVSMQDPGLVILPTHRLVSGVGDLTAGQLGSLLGGHFDLETAGKGEQGARDAWERIEAHGGQDMLAFGTAADGAWQTARFRSPQMMAELAADHSPAWRGLAVSVLHVAVLNRLLPSAATAALQCRYVHLLGEVTAAVAGRQCQLAVLVPPATMAHVEDIAGKLEKMPPKSTYFYPKLLSGLVFHSLKGN